MGGNVNKNSLVFSPNGSNVNKIAFVPSMIICLLLTGTVHQMQMACKIKR
jgi:hypothetical protein